MMTKSLSMTLQAGLLSTSYTEQVIHQDMSRCTLHRRVKDKGEQLHVLL